MNKVFVNNTNFSCLRNRKNGFINSVYSLRNNPSLSFNFGNNLLISSSDRDEDSNLCIQFGTDGEVLTGARPQHLANKDIIVAERTEDGSFVPHWDRIYRKCGLSCRKTARDEAVS